MTEAAAPAGLKALNQRLNQDLNWLELPAKPWTPEAHVEGSLVHDVVVVGGGMAGLASATALRLCGLKVKVIDQAPAGTEGPWATFGRMQTLRSPKSLTGPCLGLPALTFRAWFEAQYGFEAWAKLDKIPRLQWMDYLVWYRQVMQVPLQNDTRLVRLEPHPVGVRLKLDGTENPDLYARHVVLATGRDGLGGPFVPDIIQSLDRHLWAHSADDIDFAALSGKRVGVIGAGASAMDNAACALEAGAASLDLFIRRAEMPTINKGKGGNHRGSFLGYADLPDEWKWRQQHYLNRQQVPPPRDSTLRVSRHDQAAFHLNSPILALTQEGQALQLTTPKGVYELDFLIAATGFDTRIDRRPELALALPHIQVWGDRYSPPEGLNDASLAASPDLSSDFSFREKQTGQAQWITRLHAFNYAATLSLGKISGDIPGISDGAWRLAQGICSRLNREDPQAHMDRLIAYDDPELLGDEWTDADQAATQA